MPPSELDPHQAIRLVAGRVLDTRLDELVHRAVDRLRADEPEYATSEVSRADVIAMMRRTLALTRAAGRPIPPAIADAAAEAGRVRARQRLPLPALLHAFRIDLRILWEAIIDEGRRGLAANESFVESPVLLRCGLREFPPTSQDCPGESHREGPAHRATRGTGVPAWPSETSRGKKCFRCGKSEQVTVRAAVWCRVLRDRGAGRRAQPASRCRWGRCRLRVVWGCPAGRLRDWGAGKIKSSLTPRFGERAHPAAGVALVRRRLLPAVLLPCGVPPRRRWQPACCRRRRGRRARARGARARRPKRAARRRQSAGSSAARRARSRCCAPSFSFLVRW